LGRMARQIKPMPHLAALLRSHLVDISAIWAEMLHDLRGTRYDHYPLEQVRAWTARAIEAAIQAFVSGSYQDAEAHLIELALTRLEMGFGISEVIRGLWLFKDAAAYAVGQEYSPGSAEAEEASANLDAYLRFAISRFGHVYAEALTRDLLEEQKRTALLLEAVKTVNSSLDLSQVLQWTVEKGAEIFRLGCTLCLLDEEKKVLRPVARAGYPGEAQGTLAQSTRCLAADDLIRTLLEHNRPIVSCDATADARFGPGMVQALGLKSTLAAPITAEDRVLGVLLCSTLEQYRDFASKDVELVEGLGKAVGLAVQNAQLYETTRRRLAEMESLQRVTTALLQELTLEEILEMICFEAQQLTSAQGSTVLLLEDEAHLRIAQHAGDPLPTSDRLPTEGTLAGQAMIRRTPLLINDVESLAQAYDSVPGLENLLVVPLSAGSSTIGVLDIVNKPGGFTPEDAQVMSLFADQVALAIDSASLHQQAEQLAVIKERQRLARELHDSVTQALYSVTLYAEATRMALSAGKGDVARENLRELQIMAREAMIDMRVLIFELHPPVLEEEGLVAALQARLASVESRAGLQTEIRVEGERRLPLPVEEELFWIAMEAFNNVIKHAGAQRVEVSLRFTDGCVRLEIADDGQGFDPARVRESGGMGLKGIEDRVQRIHGQLELTSASGQGTALRVVAAV
jgi:signal transduction histidine kinase